MRWKRWILPLLVATAIVAAIIWGMRPQPVLVEAAEVKRGMLRVTVEEEGKTRVKERYVIASPITGRMQRIELEVGDAIRSGQVLTAVAPLPAVFLDPRSRAQGQAAVESATAQLAAQQERLGAAKANAAYWRAELERSAELVKSGDLARSRLDLVQVEDKRAAAALREVQAAIEAAQAEVRRATAALEQPASAADGGGASVPVIAPAAGRLLRLLRQSAGPVSAGEPLVEIADAQAIEVEVELLSPDAVQVKPGTRVMFTRWGGEAVLEGRVLRIEPTGRTKISALGVEEQRVPVISAITSPEEQRRGLGAGYRVEAAFVLWEGENVLQIPSSAVFRNQNNAAVFVIDGTFARRRQVKLGRRAGLLIQVLEGLEPGETIVAHPDSTVEDGTLVRTR